MINFNIKAAIIALLMAPILCNVALANNQDKIISGKISTDFLDSYTYDSNNRLQEFNQNHLRSILDLKANISKNIYLKTKINLEETYPQSTIDKRANDIKADNRSFEDEALILKDLTLNFTYKNAEFSAGKFTTNFGQSWEKADNIWVFDKARMNYRQDEKIGFSTNFKAGSETKNGLYKIGLAIFNNDTKYFDQSLITKRDESSKSDSVAGDKRGLSSYLASMDINYDFGKEEKLSYHFSYLNLAVNKNYNSLTSDKIEDAKAYVLNINYDYPICNNLSANGFVEYVNFDNFEGNKDQSKDFLTTNLSFYLFKQYGIGFDRYISNKKVIDSDETKNEVRELNLSYKFNEKSIFEGLSLIAGIKREINDETSTKVKDNSAGVRIRYVKEF